MIIYYPKGLTEKLSCTKFSTMENAYSIDVSHLLISKFNNNNQKKTYFNWIFCNLPHETVLHFPEIFTFLLNPVSTMIYQTIFGFSICSKTIKP